MKKHRNSKSKFVVKNEPKSCHIWIRFDCKFTDEIRKVFKEKREALGMTYSTLAEILDVNWSTVRKWETGKTQYCNIRHRPLIEEFLNGKLDIFFKQYHNEELARNALSRNLSPKIASVLEKIENTYKLCADYPELCENLWKGLDSLSVQTLKMLLTANTQKKKTN